MKNKNITLIIAALALVISGCNRKPKTPSISSVSNDTTTSAISTTSEGESSSSAVSSDSLTSFSSASSSASSSSASSSNSFSYSVPPIEDDTRWNINLSLRGTEFRNALQTIMAGKKTNSATYKECLSIGAKAAAYPKATSSTFVPFYHDTSLTTTTGSCNREHTWPNSRGTGTSGPGADPFIIRPTLSSENSDRGNLFYGSKGKNKGEWDPASCGFEAARGEAARVILYAATMYYKNGLALSNNPNDSASLHTMGTLSTLLDWNLTYAPTPIEIQINNYLSENGYGRNPFVDHPGYATYIWGTGGGTGGDKPVNFDESLNVESSLDNLDGNEFVIVSSESASSTSYYAMDNKPSNDTRPWYINGTSVALNTDKTKLALEDGITLKRYKFIKQDDGNYYIQNKETNNYLFAYIDGTHYSIGLGATPTNGGSKSWNITTNGKGFAFKNDANVYFEYYKGSFCGFSKPAPAPIYLFH